MAAEGHQQTSTRSCHYREQIIIACVDILAFIAIERRDLDATAATPSRLVKRKSSKRNGADAARRRRRDDNLHL